MTLRLIAFLIGLLIAAPSWAQTSGLPSAPGIPLSTSDASSVTKNSNVFSPDTKQNPFSVQCGADVTGSATFSVQYTYDYARDPTVTPKWRNHPIVTSATADSEAAFDRPVVGIRLQQTGGSGSVAMTCIQAGPRG